MRTLFIIFINNNTTKGKRSISPTTAIIQHDNGDKGEQPSHDASDDESKIADGRRHRFGWTAEGSIIIVHVGEWGELL